jgi:hypothetical protein
VQSRLLDPKNFSWVTNFVILGNLAGNYSKNAKFSKFKKSVSFKVNMKKRENINKKP